ncbi:MAG: YdiU family protein [Rubellimicrobium sp.]|nr:YdiU family protein [Rubellimicrobium sp.]
MATLPFDNSYARLPERMFARVQMQPVTAPRLVALNAVLAREIGLDPARLRSPEGVAWLAGNLAPPGAEPVAAAYGGHQFGTWNPQLGDGRALLLGELVGPDGRRRDWQLKGSGPTRWSRGADGRAWLGPVLREYLVSEAMFTLGIPTTRALAATLTGDQVARDEYLPGAVLARVASSHIRVGTFQYFAARGDTDALRALTDHVIARHWPDADGPLGLLAAVVGAQARLVAKWMAVGFVHGVMNTDNMTVSGETIDYGPCAFLDGFSRVAVFSSIDRRGRYAYGNQPRIALWNLTQFATALVPLFDDRAAAVADLTGVLEGFADSYAQEWNAVFAAKIGLQPGEASETLVRDLLDLMEAGGSDFTATFTALGEGTARDRIADRDAFDIWARRWQAAGPDAALMRATNPRVIPRHYLIEAAITAARAGDFAPFEAMLAAVTRPFAPDAKHERPPEGGERVTLTFCGT